MRSFFLTAVVLFLAVLSFGQKSNTKYVIEPIMAEEINTGSSAQKVVRNENKVFKLEFDGTFQFILFDNRKPLLSNDVLSFVEDNRQEDEDIILLYAENIKIYIPSQSVISSTEFTPLSLYK